MGGGIAYQSASTGTPIMMKDIDQSGINSGLKEAGSLLSKQVNRGRLNTKKMAQILSILTPTLHYDGIENANLIVEAVVENPAVKKAVLSEVETKTTENTILCSNTSTIPITELASALTRPENFCGMHFFNPVPVMKLVEIVRGLETDDETYKVVEETSKLLAKVPVPVNDFPGFVSNRVLMPMINEAVFVLGQSTAGIEDIDKGCRLGLWVAAAPADAPEVRQGPDLLLAVWRHEGVGYALMATDMDPRRFASLARLLETRTVGAAQVARDSGSLTLPCLA